MFSTVKHRPLCSERQQLPLPQALTKTLEVVYPACGATSSPSPYPQIFKMTVHMWRLESPELAAGLDNIQMALVVIDENLYSLFKKSYMLALDNHNIKQI